MKLVGGAFALLLVLSLTTLAPSANATIELKISDGTNSVDILDQGAGDICNLAADTNLLCFNGNVGNWSLSVTTGRSKDQSAPFSIDLNGNSKLKLADATTLTIQLSDNGFSPAVNGDTLHIGGTLAPGATLVAQAFGGTTTGKFDFTHQIGGTLTFTDPPLSDFSGNTTGAFTGVDNYGLTIQTQLTFAAGASGLVTYDANLDPVPEPASVALLGGILLAAGGAIRRKLRRS